MIKDLIKRTFENIAKGLGRLVLVFAVLALIFLIIQPMFHPIVTFILGLALVAYIHHRFFKTSTKIFGNILDAGKTGKVTSYKANAEQQGDKYDQAYIYREIKEADELNLKNSLDEALVKYEAVLRRVSLENNPEAYAHVNFNVGVIYTKLESTLKAIEAYEQCLKVYSIEKHPIDFALAQGELAGCYGKLSRLSRREDYALTAACDYEQALRVFTAQAYPLHYAAIQNNLGNLYGSLVTSLEQLDYYSKAFSAYNEAMKYITEDINPEVFKLVKDNFALTNLRSLTSGSGIEYYDFRIVKNLDKIIGSDYRRDQYIRGLKPVVKHNFYYLNDEELNKLCDTLADISKELEDYYYSPQEMVDALYSYMEFARLNTGNVFGDVNKALEHFKTVYKWATPETENYRERLIPVIERWYGYLKPHEKSQLCKTICEVAKLRGNYRHSPEEMVSDISHYVGSASLDIRDVIGNVHSTLEYLTQRGR